MDTPEGKVIGVGSHSASVSVDPAAVCAKCAAGRGCGAGLFGKRRRPTLIEVNVPADMHLKSGDRIRLELIPAHLLHAAWLAYGLPLVGMVFAVIVASRLAPANELAAVLSAAFGLAAGALLGRRTLARSGCLRQCVPTASEKLSRLPDANPSHP